LYQFSDFFIHYWLSYEFFNILIFSFFSRTALCGVPRAALCGVPRTALCHAPLPKVDNFKSVILGQIGQYLFLFINFSEKNGFC